MRVLALALAAGTVAAAPSMEQAGACVKACDEGDCNGLVKKFQAPCHDCIVACGDELPPMSEVIDDAKEWTADQWEAVETDKLDEFLEEAKKKGPEFWKELTADMDWKTAATWSKKQWDAVPIDDIVGMGWEKLQQVPWEEWGRMSQEQLGKVPVDTLVKMLGDQIAKLDAETIAGLSDKYWDKIPVEQLAEFTAATFQNICLKVKDSKEVEAKCPDWVHNLDAEKIASIAGDAWTNIPVNTIVGFSLDQLQSINYDALGTWTKEMWDKMPVETLLRFTGEQISQVPPEAVKAWTDEMWKSIKVDQLIQLTGEQLSAIPFDQLAAKLSKLTNAQIEKLSADTLNKLRADDSTASILKALEEAKAETDDVLDKIKEHNDAKAEVIVLKETLGVQEARPDATDAEIEEAKKKLNEAEATESTAAKAVDEAKTLAGMPTLADEYSTNSAPRVGGASLAATAAAALLATLVHRA